MTREAGPRTAEGRQLARYRARTAAARAAVQDAEPDARGIAMARLDEVYVGGAPIRSRDPEVRQLRRRDPDRLPIANRPGLVVWLTEDPARGLVLINGWGNVYAVLVAAGCAREANWSPSGQGWLLTPLLAANVAAWCQHTGTLYRVRTRPTEGAT